MKKEKETKEIRLKRLQEHAKQMRLKRKYTTKKCLYCGAEMQAIDDVKSDKRKRKTCSLRCRNAFRAYRYKLIKIEEQKNDRK